jgi:hypothetical protein
MVPNDGGYGYYNKSLISKKVLRAKDQVRTCGSIRYCWPSFHYFGGGGFAGRR